MTEVDARARLTLRVKTRLVAQGLSDEGANRTALAVVANYYEGAFDAYYWLVQAEAMTMMAEIIPPVASNMAVAWQRLAAGVDAMALFGSADEPEGVDKEFPPSDFISGHPDHYHVNGYNDSCRHEDCRYGHHKLCQVWADPDWLHKPSLCLMTRVQCQHRPKHRYGQKCDAYKPGADYFDAQDEVDLDLIAGPLLSVVPSQPLETDHRLANVPADEPAFLHTDECVEKGRHLRGDCDKIRPTCQHDPQHKYAERCPK